MVIASIDLKGGRVVQLKNGRDLMLERDDPEALIAEFNKYGEVAVIDLDAALGARDASGKTANTDILKGLLRRGNVRVGGGVRDVKTAKELVSLGAEKVIVGSAAFKAAEGAPTSGPSGGDDSGPVPLNVEFLEALGAAVGRERIIISVDAINGNIAVNGWTKTSGVPLIAGARAAEKYCSELLFTCVEKEGCMGGTDMDAVKRLREGVSTRLVAAGGVSTLEEVAALARIGVDAQLGMALYTGAVNLADCFAECLDWQKSPLIPVIAQSPAGEVLMLGFANKDAIRATFASGRLTFWSRTRNRLWTKGETSGNFLRLLRLRADCDRDTVLATVVPQGPVCHTGSWSCFSSEAAEESSLERLWNIVEGRFANPAPGSYTATLDAQRVREKILEEAEELTEAAGPSEVIWECADLLYFMTVLMNREGVAYRDVLDELDRRHKQ
ncbi:MAG: bifunctional phosphoribosyl-AMP cyclohydrolase/phosphoribosyl-ATP diphosphatase HisIE [Spirochaetaceae bacterium]|jgi:phosphoribosyl-ATP pyrophosphohydrolase/phosphoribosyl-AMP cyclohydrolase|nr:bifunctional phosphoribosyl-AMP cyclohydrolase/phosphoribosyl-ATP diphosphatase HisIE [Spirochaetaceae bacterium]